MKSTCRGCGKVFSSVRSFDRHRTGPFSARQSRRCLSDEEMVDKGFHLNTRGWWSNAAAKDALAIGRLHK